MTEEKNNKINRIFDNKPVTLEEINENWDSWWNQLSDSDKARLATEAEVFMKENIEKLLGPWN